MADGDKVGFRHIVPSLFNGVATALTAAAGLIGVLYQTGYLGNRAPQPAAEVAARARAHMRMHDDTELAAVASRLCPDHSSMAEMIIARHRRRSPGKGT
jgi:hypothetical protein